MRTTFLSLMVSVSLTAYLPLCVAAEADAPNPEKKHEHAEVQRSEKEHTERGLDESGHDSANESHEEGHEEEEASASVGPGKAVEAISHEGVRLKLAPAAIRRLGVKAEKFSVSLKRVTLPRTAIVDSLKTSAIFRQSLDGWYEFVPVKVSARTETSVSISSELFSSQENIVVSGVPLLRAAQLEASGQGGEGHGH